MTSPSRKPSTAAGTRTRAARCAWGTAKAVPCRRHPSPSRSARTVGWLRGAGRHLVERRRQQPHRPLPRRREPTGLLLRRVRSAPGGAHRGRGWPTTGPAPRPGPAARARGTARSGRGPNRRAPRGPPGRAGWPWPARPTGLWSKRSAVVLDLGHTLDARHALEDRRGRLGHRQLLLGEVEVHQAVSRLGGARHGRNIGIVSSSSTATISTSRACRCGRRRDRRR